MFSPCESPPNSSRRTAIRWERKVRKDAKFAKRKPGDSFVAFFAIFASLRTLRSNPEFMGVGCGEAALCTLRLCGDFLGVDWIGITENLALVIAQQHIVAITA